MANELTLYRRLTEPQVRIVSHQPHPGILVCAITGEIDLVTAPVLRRALGRALHSPTPTLILDLSQVDFLGAIGVGLVQDTAHRATHDHRTFALVVNTALVRRVLDITGTGAPTHPSIRAAVSACENAVLPR